MNIFKGQNLLEFSDRFKTDADCKKYLADIKWNNGFTCVKCGHKKAQVRKDYSRTCNICSHQESATDNTLFHKVKFGIRKAFFIIFEMSTSTKSLSASYVSVRFGVTPTTARLFMHKVREAMSSSGNYPMDGEVHVDEFVLGGRDDHISREAKVTTDKWKGYRPIAKVYDIEQIESNKGLNFKALHTMIHQMKSWIRSTYSWVSDLNVNRYFNEFCFRVNRSQSKSTIFNNLVKRMVGKNKIYHKKIICS